MMTLLRSHSFSMEKFPDHYITSVGKILLSSLFIITINPPAIKPRRQLYLSAAWTVDLRPGAVTWNMPTVQTLNLLSESPCEHTQRGYYVLTSYPQRVRITAVVDPLHPLVVDVALLSHYQRAAG